MEAEFDSVDIGESIRKQLDVWKAQHHGCNWVLTSRESFGEFVAQITLLEGWSFAATSIFFLTANLFIAEENSIMHNKPHFSHLFSCY